jgi:hypothetical protein
MSERINRTITMYEHNNAIVFPFEDGSFTEDANFYRITKKEIKQMSDIIKGYSFWKNSLYSGYTAKEKVGEFVDIMGVDIVVFNVGIGFKQIKNYLELKNDKRNTANKDTLSSIESFIKYHYHKKAYESTVYSSYVNRTDFYIEEKYANQSFVSDMHFWNYLDLDEYINKKIIN